MAVNGAGRLLRLYAARVEGGRTDIPGVLRSVGEAYLPAKPHTVRGFIAAQVKAGKKPATIQRYVATISRVHTAAHLHNPCSSEAVRLGLKKMGRETSTRQDQAHPLNWKDIKEFIDTAGAGLRADRERAVLCVRTKPSPVAASSWRSRSATLISIRTAPVRR